MVSLLSTCPLNCIFNKKNAKSKLKRGQSSTFSLLQVIVFSFKVHQSRGFSCGQTYQVMLRMNHFCKFSQHEYPKNVNLAQESLNLNRHHHYTQIEVHFGTWAADGNKGHDDKFRQIHLGLNPSVKYNALNEISSTKIIVLNTYYKKLGMIS